MNDVRLFDGRSEPGFPGYLAEQLAAARVASFAIRRIRLARLDLSAEAWTHVRSCRLLLSRLDADALDFGRMDSARTAAYLDLAASGRLEIRSAGLGSWEPDFSIFGSVAAPRALIVGCHRFAPVEPTDGPFLACATADPDAVRSALARFEEIWTRGYDALDAVIDALGRAQVRVDAHSINE